MAVECAVERKGASLAAGRHRVQARPPYAKLPVRLCVKLCATAQIAALVLVLTFAAGSRLARAQQTANTPASDAAPAGQSAQANQKKQPDPAGKNAQAAPSSSQASGQSAGQAGNSQADQAGTAGTPDADDDVSDDPYLRDAPGGPGSPAEKKNPNGQNANAGANQPSNQGANQESNQGANGNDQNSGAPSGPVEQGAASGNPAQPVPEQPGPAQPDALTGGGNADANASAATESAVPPAGAAAPLAASAAAVPAQPLSPEDLRKQQVASECANLLKMATDLKAQVDKSSKDELSIGVIRKASEVEQYAHKLRSDPGLTAGKD